MALLESILQPSVAVGFAAGLVGVRYLASATGTILRPVAKGVVKSALMVSDGVSSIIAESQPNGQARVGHDKRGGVRIRVGSASTESAHQERQRPRRRSESRTRRSTGRKARSA
jgi:hypothetical protein